MNRPAEVNCPSRLVDLVLELRHPAQLAVGDVALHDPPELAVLAHVTLREHGGHVGVEPDGEQHRRERHRGIADDTGLLGDRERVEVDDAVERVAFVLPANPVLERTEVVAEVDVTGRLHAGQHPRLVVAARVAHDARRYPSWVDRGASVSWRPGSTSSGRPVRRARADSVRTVASDDDGRCRNARVRGALRSAAAADPQRTGRHLRGQPLADRRRLSGRDREDAAAPRTSTST